MENLKEVTGLYIETERAIQRKVAEFGIYTNVIYKRVTCSYSGVWVTIAFDEKPHEGSFHLSWDEIRQLCLKERHPHMGMKNRRRS